MAEAMQGRTGSPPQKKRENMKKKLTKKEKKRTNGSRSDAPGRPSLDSIFVSRSIIFAFLSAFSFLSFFYEDRRFFIRPFTRGFHY